MKYLAKDEDLESIDFREGVVLPINKPLAWTSFDVVNKVRWLLRRKYQIKKFKVGHAGTLDPLADGLLILCTGKATKTIETYQAQEKEYTGVIRLGMTTPTYDSEMEPDKHFPTDHISVEQIETARKTFLGKIKQTPPIFSALKKDGVRAYKLAREGKEVELKQRDIEIMDFEIEKIEMPDIHFRVKCSKGTYIRSLAYDFGKAVDSGGYLAALTRTKIGDFSNSQAWNLPELVESLEKSIQSE